MATTKDVTKEKQAKTVQDVNEQDSRTRLWQSLNTTYGHQMDESDKAYDTAISKQDNAQLARGMGRSSYAGQIRANMLNDKVTARNKLGEDLIADYQNRIGDIEKQENEEAWRQKEFEEGQRQFNEGQAFQREQNELNRLFQTSEREAQQKWQAGENALGRAFTTAEREAQQRYQSGENALNRAFTTSEREAQQRYNTSEREAQQKYSTSERLAQQGWQSNENALNRAFTTSEREAQQRYNTSERLSQQEYQSGENALNRAFTTSERIAQQNWQAQQAQLNRDAEVALQKLNQEFQSKENALSRQTQKDLQTLEQAWQSGENQKNREAQEALTRLEQEFQSGENAKNRELQEYLQTLSQAFTAEQNALNRQMEMDQFDANLAFQQSEAARNQSNWEISQAFAEKQWEAQQEQWKEEFEYNKMSTDQKLYYNYIMKALEVRGSVSDEMLAKAGISRADFNAMMHQMEQNMNNGYTGSYGSASVQKPGGTTDKTKPTTNGVLDQLNSYTAPSSGKEVPTSSNDPSKKGTVKTNPVVYITEKSKYEKPEDKTGKRSTVDKRQVTWKSTLSQ